MNENIKWDEEKEWTYLGGQEKLVMDSVIRG